MRLAGRIWKTGKHWLVEVPTLDATTQGRTRAETVRMIGDLIATMADAEGSSVTVRSRSSSVIGIETSDVATLVSVMLRRQREKHGLSVGDVAKRPRHS